MAEVSLVWVILSSTAVGITLKWVLDLIVSVYGSKGQFKRDRAGVAGLIYEKLPAKKDDGVKECVEKWGKIYTLLEVYFKKNK